jgi:hypothetical protein
MCMRSVQVDGHRHGGHFSGLLGDTVGDSKMADAVSFPRTTSCWLSLGSSRYCATKGLEYTEAAEEENRTVIRD